MLSSWHRDSQAINSLSSQQTSMLAWVVGHGGRGRGEGKRREGKKRGRMRKEGVRERGRKRGKGRTEGRLRVEGGRS